LTGSSPLLTQYIRSDHRKVEGWLLWEAILMTAAIGEIQDNFGVKGNIGEIGLWQGKFFILLANLAGADETCLAIDSFVHGPAENQSAFLRNVQTYTDCNSRMTLIREDSKAVSDEKMSSVAGRGFKLFSVDGGHTADDVFNDLKLVAPHMIEGGVLIADDVFNHTQPEVMDGLFQFFQSANAHDLRPFALAGNKVFLAHREWASRFYDRLWAKVQAAKDSDEWIRIKRYYAGEGSAKNDGLVFLGGKVLVDPGTDYYTIQYLDRQCATILGSYSYRLGRAMTWPFRLLIGAVDRVVPSSKNAGLAGRFPRLLSVYRRLRG